MGLSQRHASVVQGQIPEEHKQGDLALSSSILATGFFSVKYSYSSSVLAPKYHFPVPQAP